MKRNRGGEAGLRVGGILHGEGAELAGQGMGIGNGEGGDCLGRRDEFRRATGEGGWVTG